ncbi:hypothetical protein AR456_12175 [Halomonas huangheensis]|nr:hypothetical protein AR456_12175 [Halomonas huangheensis]
MAIVMGLFYFQYKWLATLPSYRGAYGISMILLTVLGLYSSTVPCLARAICASGEAQRQTVCFQTDELAAMGCGTRR